MIRQVLPILLIVAANSMYHISFRSVSKNADSMAALAFTYVLAAVGSILVYNGKSCYNIMENERKNRKGITVYETKRP